MNEQFVVIQGVVGSDAQGFSVHRHSGRDGQNSYSAYIGLRDGSRLVWQEIEMRHEQARQFDGALASGNTVRVSGLLKKHMGVPLYRVQADDVQLIHATEPIALRKAA